MRVILFVKLAPGVELTDDLKNTIRKTIRMHASPRHVPAKIIPVPDIPYTLNMKKVELAVKKVIHNQVVKNKDALRIPRHWITLPGSLSCRRIEGVGERDSDETFDLCPVVRIDTWTDRILKILKTLDILAHHRILFHVVHIAVHPCIGGLPPQILTL